MFTGREKQAVTCCITLKIRTTFAQWNNLTFCRPDYVLQEVMILQPNSYNLFNNSSKNDNRVVKLVFKILSFEVCPISHDPCTRQRKRTFKESRARRESWLFVLTNQFTRVATPLRSVFSGEGRGSEHISL